MRLYNKTRQEDVLEQIKQDYGFGEIKDAFDEGFVPESV